MKKLTTLLLSLLAVSASYAQPYTFSVQNSPYVDMTVSNSVNNGITWDDPYFEIPIGFTFKLGNYTMTELSISDFGTGGFLSTVGQGVAQLPFIIAMSADLIDRGSDTANFQGQPNSLSPISYLTSGAAGNRIFKLEFENAGFYIEMYQDNKSTDFVNFQVWLYEGSNNIEIRFGSSLLTDPISDFDGETGPLFGVLPDYDDITGNLPTPAQSLEGLAANPAIKTITSVEDLTYITGYPVTGAVYKFTNTSVGINPVQVQLNNIQLTPNPATSFINLDYPLGEKIQSVQLVNLNGQVLNTVGTELTRVDISTVPAGVYFLNFTTETGLTVSKKFIKN